MMHIVMSGNRTVLSGIEVVIYSTMLHNRNVHWHVFSMDVDIWDNVKSVGHKYVGLTQIDEQWLRYIVKFLDSESELTVHNVIEPYLTNLDGSVNRCTAFTPYAGLRLLADIVLPDVSHCWYFDADLIVQSDVSDMYRNLCLNKDYDYAAYVVPEANGWVGEMISGVLIMNLAKARKTGWLKRARYNYNHFQYKYPDQSALEHTATPYPLDETYGYLQDHRKVTYKPKILHCTHVNPKIYDSNMGVERFYQYFPEHRYIKDGIEIIREVYDRDKIVITN